MARKYHQISYGITCTGDIFRINGRYARLPFSASTQTPESIIPENNHILGMLLKHLAAVGCPVTSKLVLELDDAVCDYLRNFRNNPSAAKRHLNGDLIPA